jgi:PAS domain S-box-containing protein
VDQSTVSALTPEATQERADLFRLMADSSDDVIRLIDAEGRNVYVSEAATRLLGLRPEYVFERIHPDDLAAGQRWWQCMLAGGSERFTWRVLDRHGAWRWLETWGRSVQYREQRYILTICRDVTQRVQVMEALRDNERRLEDAQRIAHIGSWDNDLGADQIKWSDETYRILAFSLAVSLPPQQRCWDGSIRRTDTSRPPPPLMHWVATTTTRRSIGSFVRTVRCEPSTVPGT